MLAAVSRSSLVSSRACSCARPTIRRFTRRSRMCPSWLVMAMPAWQPRAARVCSLTCTVQRAELARSRCRPPCRPRSIHVTLRRRVIHAPRSCGVTSTVTASSSRLMSTTWRGSSLLALTLSLVPARLTHWIRHLLGRSTMCLHAPNSSRSRPTHRARPWHAQVAVEGHSATLPTPATTSLPSPLWTRSTCSMPQ